MPLAKVPQEILIIEDNPGDYLLITESISEGFVQPVLHQAATFAQAKIYLQQNKYNIILLDLSLPDAQGETLVREMVQLAELTPIIVLTGYSDKDFGVKTLQLGVSDYLLKDELNGSQLYKSITYSIERKRIHTELNESQEKYRRLFQLSPLPMWVFNTDTLRLIDVNEAAIRHYGYTREEFLTMMIQEIRPASDAGYVTEEVWDHMRSGEYFNDHVIHQKKSGELISVVIESNSIDLDGQRARLVLGTDVTEKLKAEEALKQSERRFKALVQDSADIIAIINKEGDYLYVSPTSYSVLGLEPESFMGKNAFNFIHPDDASRIQSDLSELSAKKRVKTDPFRINILGKDFWMETILTDMTNDAAVEGIVVNASDVTQRIEYENQISEGLERYNTVSKATSDVIYDWDFAEDSVIWNRGVEGVFGYSDVSITANSWWYERVHPEEVGQVAADVQSHITEKKLRWQGEYRFRCADGNFKYVLDRSFLVYDTSGKPVRMIGAMQDITDRTAYIQAIEKQNRKLREIAWLQSHVVRAPLSRIMGLIGLLKDNPADEQAPEMLDHILASAFELDEIISSIVNRAAEAEDYSKPDGDEFTSP